MEDNVPSSVAHARFGLRGEEVFSPAMERVEVKVSTEEVVFAMRLEGRNVFQGVLEGVMGGWVDGRRVPGWLTGEEGASEMRVVHGRVVRPGED
jgi:central kinetochore subunit Mis15/CHL4